MQAGPLANVLDFGVLHTPFSADAPILVLVVVAVVAVIVVVAGVAKALVVDGPIAYCVVEEIKDVEINEESESVEEVHVVEVALVRSVVVNPAIVPVAVDEADSDFVCVFLVSDYSLFVVPVVAVAHPTFHSHRKI
jgi:hypothetical protein